MNVRLCPSCNRVFFSLIDADCPKCYHCGFLFLDRRNAQRVRGDISLELSTDEGPLRAKLKDYSNGGLRIFYIGQPLDVDSLLSINIEGLGLKGSARTVWTYRLSKYTALSGLEILNHNNKRTTSGIQGLKNSGL